MKVNQWSDWSVEPCKNTQSKDNAWVEDNNEKKRTNRLKISSPHSLLYGVLIGSLLSGLALAVVLTVWLTSTQSASTNISSASSPSTTLSITSSLSNSTTSSTISTTISLSTTSTTTTVATTSVSTITTTHSSTLTITAISSTIASTIITTSTTTSPPNLLINPGAETGNLSPWIIGGTGVPAIDSGTANSGYNPNSGTKDFYGGQINTGSSSTLTQNILLLNGTQGYTEVQLDSGNLYAHISFSERSYYQFLGTDDAQISVAFRTLNNTLISRNTTSIASCTNNWCVQSYSYSLPTGTRRLDYIMIFQLQTGSTIDSYLDDNSLQVY